MQDILIHDSALEDMGFQTSNSSKQFNSIRKCYLKMCDNSGVTIRILNSALISNYVVITY